MPTAITSSVDDNIYPIPAVLNDNVTFPPASVIVTNEDPTLIPFTKNAKLFTDVGGVYDFDIKKAGTYSRNDINDSKDARISYGVGLIWNTRIAPIRIDYALRLRKKSYDEVQPWHLRFSTHF